MSWSAVWQGRARAIRVAVVGAVSASVLVATVADERPAAAQAAGPGFAGGAVTEINPSGAWSWFEGPRAMHTDCELLVGSVSKSGMIEVSTTRLDDGTTRIDRVGGPVEADDHNSPGLVELPDGKIAAAWSRHHRDVEVHNVERPRSMWNWLETPSVNASGQVTYSNLVRLSDEGPHGRLYNFFRGDGFDSIFSYSDNQGRTWSDPAKLIRKYAHRPYVVFDDDGRRRIDVATTEGHPRDYTTGTGVFHGYVQGGFIRRSNGTIVGTTGYGVAPEELTRVYQQSPDERAWTLDVATPTEATPATIAISVRDLAETTPTHLRNRYLYATWNGSQWTVNELAFAGDSLYAAEEFYTGGVAIDPADPSHVVISTNVDPTTGIRLPPAPGRTVAAYELYDGFTADGGATWTFEPITDNSVESNIRPVIPEPGPDARSLVWLQGRYSTYQSYDTRVMGIVEGGATTACPEPLETYGADPFPGDFDGDGRTDWFHYQPGAAPDAVFWGDGDRTSLNVIGTYDPQVRRVPGGRDQIIWSGPVLSYKWTARGHRFDSARVTHATNVQLLIGDFDGDGTDDVFHYRAGTASDRIYWSNGTSTPLNVNGVYEPIMGDFTGDGIDDILWYAPGGRADYYWRFRPGHQWTSHQTRINGDYDVAVGDLDDNRTDDIFWRRDNGGGYQWRHARASTPRPTSVPVL